MQKVSKPIKFLAFVTILAAGLYFGFDLKNKYVESEKKVSVLQEKLTEAKKQRDSAQSGTNQSTNELKTQVKDLTEQLEETKKREKLLERKVQAVKRTKRSNGSKNGNSLEYGMVTAILYGQDSSSAVINNQIIYEGDTLRDVTVVKIHKTTVEFEKNGVVWQQRVRQRPHPAWNDDLTEE